MLVAKGGSVPAWVAVAELALILFLFVLVRRRGGRLAELEPVRSESEQLRDQPETYDYALERYGLYSSHLAHVLDHLQRVISGDIDVGIPEYISRGILEPARDVLMEDSDEDIRLSILLPEQDDCFVMTWSAGHDLESQSDPRVPSARRLPGSRTSQESFKYGETPRRMIGSKRTLTRLDHSTRWFLCPFVLEITSLGSLMRSHRSQMSLTPPSATTCFPGRCPQRRRECVARSWAVAWPEARPSDTLDSLALFSEHPEKGVGAWPSL